MGNLTISAAGVVFNRCRFRYVRGDFANGQGGYGIRTSGSGTVTLNDCQSDGGGAGGGIYGMSFGKYTLNRTLIHGWGHGLQATGGQIFCYDSAVIDSGLDEGVSPVEHLDAIQFGGGSNYEFDHCVFECIDPTAPFNVQTYDGVAVDDLSVTNNWFFGAGGYLTQLRPNVQPITNVLWAGNQYNRSPNVGAYFGGVPYGTGFFPLGGQANGSQCANDHQMAGSVLAGSTGNRWWDTTGGTPTGLQSGAS